MIPIQSTYTIDKIALMFLRLVLCTCTTHDSDSDSDSERKREKGINKQERVECDVMGLRHDGSLGSCRRLRRIADQSNPVKSTYLLRTRCHCLSKRSNCRQPPKMLCTHASICTDKHTLLQFTSAQRCKPFCLATALLHMMHYSLPFFKKKGIQG